MKSLTSLPVELQKNIVCHELHTLSTLSRLRHALAIAAVAPTWRKLALGEPWLWDAIDIVDRSWAALYTSTMVSRSRQVTLSVQIHADAQCRWIREAILIIRPHFARCRILHITAHSTVIDALFPLPDQLPCMESMIINIPKLDSVELGVPIAPQLRMLSISTSSGNIQRSPTDPLEELTLSGASWGNIKKFIFACVRLHRLSIDIVSPYSADILKDEATFPDLLRLSIYPDSVPILKSFVLPQLQDLEFKGVHPYSSLTPLPGASRYSSVTTLTLSILNFNLFIMDSLMLTLPKIRSLTLFACRSPINMLGLLLLGDAQGASAVQDLKLFYEDLIEDWRYIALMEGLDIDDLD
ncbi:hypothetical protein DL93DRAFT_2223614 [Clavulina sp. PMI_390]|nr:hypothetical protein DL93DRAFT_2223614 [Clavulina sp. PMI_390]